MPTALTMARSRLRLRLDRQTFLVQGTVVCHSALYLVLVFLCVSWSAAHSTFIALWSTSCICTYSFTQPVTRLAINRSCVCYSTSNYSNASAVTPTSVLPAMGSRGNHLWNHSYYVKVRNLREGSSGSVHLAVDVRYGNQVAIKFIPRGSNR